MTQRPRTAAEDQRPRTGGRADRRPGRPGRSARLGLAGWLRWAWRQLTSMRTALILLFLLALASVPGSVLPQEGIDPAAVTQYYTAHPGLAPILNKLSLFSVFAAPWFAAIYLLLFASLAGCVLPRTFRLVGSARQQPPRAPRNLARLPLSASYATALPPAQALRVGRRACSAASRFRLQHRRRLGLGREGLPARGRQPAVPHRAAGPAASRSGSAASSATRPTGCWSSARASPTRPTALDVFHPGRLVSASRPAAVLDQPA